MIIDFLELNNFISHAETRINFSGGINVILGNNGAGKSSMMDGIRFALFGDSGRGNNSDLIRHGNSVSTVRLGFHINEDKYEITRKISITKGEDSKTDAEMRRNDETYANGAKSVNASVESLFKISRDLFFNSIFVKQGEIDQLVSEKPADRKKLFSQIIGIDELQRKAEVIKTVERRIRTGSESYIVHKDEFEVKKADLEKKKQEHKSVIASMEDLSKMHDKSSKERADLKGELESLRTELIGIRQKSTDLEVRKKEIRNLEEKLESLRKRRKDFSEIDAEYRKIESESLYENRELIKSINSDIREASLVTFQLKELASKLQEIKKMREKLDSLSASYEEYKTFQIKLEENEAAIQKEKSFISEYSAVTAEHDRKAKQLKDLENKLPGLSVKIPEKYRNLEAGKLKEALEEYNLRKTEVAGRKGSFETGSRHLDAEIREANSKLEMLGGQRTCPVCGSELSEEHMKKVVSDYKDKIDTLNIDRSKIQESIKELSVESGEIQAAIEQLNSRALTDYSELAESIRRLGSEVRELSAQLADGKKRYDNLHRIDLENSELKEKLKVLDKVHSEYNRLEVTIRALGAESSVQRIDELKKVRDPVEERYRKGLEKAGIREEDVPLAIESIEKMERKITELRPQIESSRKLEESVKEIEVTLRNSRVEAETLEKAIRRLPETENAFNELNVRFESAETRSGELKSRIDSLKGTTDQLSEEIKYRQAEIEKTEGKLRKYGSIQGALKDLSEIRSALEKDGIQKFLRKESSEAITGKTRSLVSEFGLEIDDIRVDEDFDVEVSVGGSVESLSSLSGGEKTALAIALRLSVADYILNRVSTFIMDEPTTFLDEDRRGQLKNILQNSLRDQSIVPQLIVITHHQELTKAADLVYMVHKKEGASMVEPVD